MAVNLTALQVMQDAPVIPVIVLSDVAHADGQFTVITSEGRFTAPHLVIATGGPAIPKLGATGFAYSLGKQFGLRIIPPRPALVPFTLPGGESLFRELAGVAATVVASVAATVVVVVETAAVTVVVSAAETVVLDQSGMLSHKRKHQPQS